MYFLNLPFVKRLIPSFRRRIRVLFNRQKFWIKINNIFYFIDIQEKLDREFYYKKKYEENNFKFIFENKFFMNPFLFIDIGSNSGIYALRINKNFKNCIKVFAFEPILETYKKLKLNIKKNLMDNDIEALNIALSNKNGISKMKSISKNNHIQFSRFEINENGDIEVITKVFDDLYNFNNKNIFIKCDAEGSEYEVIKGMRRNLKKNNCLIQIEIFDKNFSKLNLLLEGLGYALIKTNSKTDDYFYAKS